MIEATSCGGVVIFRGKVLLLYKNYKNKYEGWVLPKGTVEKGEEEQHQNWVNHSGYPAKSERMLSAAYFASRIHRGGNLR